jgi:purine-nucleoside phosphorylase
MSTLYDRIQESAAYLAAQGAGRPAVGVILGSGLGGLAGDLIDARSVPFEAVPHFAPSTVEFHEGHIHFGRLGSVPVAVLEGRVHYYEGQDMQALVHPVRALWALGARALVVTSAVGGLAPVLAKGDLVAVSDHINLMGDNPLIGPNDERIGPRFPDMSRPYARELRELAAAVATAEGFALKTGVLAALAGPNLETAAEYRFLRRIGADVVGMSMVPENLAAVHAGLEVLGVAVVTDLCDPDTLAPVDVPEILRVAGQAQPRLRALLLGFIKEWHRRRGGEA